MVSIRDRRRNLFLWVEKFGHIRTLALEHHTGELNAQLYEWRKERSAATCNHRRDSVMNLVRVLYGKRAASGLSDVVTFPKADPKARWVPREHIAAVLAHLEPESMLQTRLMLLHWTGMRPSQMCRLNRQSFRLDHKVPHVVVGRAKRGKTAFIPLLGDGMGVALRYIATNAFGQVENGKSEQSSRESRRSSRTTQVHDLPDPAQLRERVTRERHRPRRHPEVVRSYECQDHREIRSATPGKHQKAIERLQAVDRAKTGQKAGKRSRRLDTRDHDE